MIIISIYILFIRGVFVIDFYDIMYFAVVNCAW